MAPRASTRLALSALPPDLGDLPVLQANLYVPEGVHFHSWLGFLGGTVGVLGTLITYETKRFKMKQRILCPYCEGGGVITCGACLGSGSVVRETGGEATQTSCPVCGGIGVVACVNCKGEGVTVPVALQRKQLDLPEDDLNYALEEMGIASLAANYVNQRARERLQREIQAQQDRLPENENLAVAGSTEAADLAEEESEGQPE